MTILVAVAAFFQQFGFYIMILAFATIFGASALQSRGKWKAAQWTTFAGMVLAGILAFSQLVLGAVFGNVLMLIFGGICGWAVWKSFGTLRVSGFWTRIRRMLRRRQLSDSSNRPRMN